MAGLPDRLYAIATLALLTALIGNLASTTDWAFLLGTVWGVCLVWRWRD